MKKQTGVLFMKHRVYGQFTPTTSGHVVHAVRAMLILHAIKMQVYNYFVSGPKFTKFFSQTWKRFRLKTPFPIVDISQDPFRGYFRSKSKVVENLTVVSFTSTEAIINTLNVDYKGKESQSYSSPNNVVYCGFPLVSRAKLTGAKHASLKMHKTLSASYRFYYFYKIVVFSANQSVVILCIIYFI